MKFIVVLGGVCSALDRLPTSTLLAAGLEKRGAIAVASGGLTDIWRGEYYGSPVAIKAFRIYPAQNLKEAKEVCILPARGGGLLTTENFRFFGKEYRCGGNYLIKTSYRFVGSLLHSSNSLSFTIGDITATSLSSLHPTPARPARLWYGIACCCGNSENIADLFSLRTAATGRRKGTRIPSFAGYPARRFERRMSPYNLR